MKLVQLGNRETKELEKGTIPIENITLFKEPFATLLIDLQSWYHANGLTANEPHNNFIEKLSSLLGFEPNYGKTLEYRTSVWGLGWEDQKFILYKSKRGTSIQIPKKFRKDKIQPFLEELVEQLGSKDFIKTYKKENF